MASINTYPTQVVPQNVTIASGATASDGVYLVGQTLCGFCLPAAFTGTAVTFQTSPDGVTYQTLYDSTNATIGATVTQGRNYALNPANFAGYAYVKIVSGAAEGAARTVTLMLHPV